MLRQVDFPVFCAGMTTFSSTNHEALECEEYDAGSERPDLSAPPPPPPPRVTFNQGPEDAYAAAAAASGFENAYVNALCAELSNMIQFNDNNAKKDQVRYSILLFLRGFFPFHCFAVQVRSRWRKNWFTVTANIWRTRPDTRPYMGEFSL